MEKYHYTQGMELVLKHLTELLKNDAVGSISDRALLMEYRAFCEKKPDKAIKLAKQHMEQGIQLLEQFGLVPYHDSIPQITNYAVLLTEMG